MWEARQAFPQHPCEPGRSGARASCLQTLTDNLDQITWGASSRADVRPAFEALFNESRSRKRTLWVFSSHRLRPWGG